MPTCRVFTNPDGSVCVMRLNERRRREGEADEQFLDRETAKQSELAALPFVDVDAETIPADRSRRHAWRLNAGRVIVDLSVSDPPHPRQALLDATNRATTLEELKAVLREVLR